MADIVKDGVVIGWDTALAPAEPAEDAAHISTVSLPASPVRGQVVTVLADSSTTLPSGVTWDGGGSPTIAARLLVTFVWSGADWVGTYGIPIPAVSP